jgi:glycosyltransferase involved in cell wall biosynthesis
MPTRNILFIHPNFPGQFLHLARSLAQQGHKVTGIGELENIQRQKSLVPGMRLLGYKFRRPEKSAHPHVRLLEEHALRGQATLRVCAALKKEGERPDLIAVHTGWGDSLFLREVFPEARIAGYFEYFYRPHGADIGFDAEFPHTLDNRLEVRLKNATPLLAWEDCDVRWTPTRWQASLFPTALQTDLHIAHEGIDTNLVRPRPGAALVLPGGDTVRAGDEVLTFVNRNLEPYRGIHVFLRALPAILRQRPNARVLIVGTENDTAYGNRPLDGRSWKNQMLDELGDRIDRARVHFLGRLPFEGHLRVLQVSRAHVYLTYPYFLSWSMLEALSAGCVVIGSDTPPVTEFLEDEKNGLLVDFFDTGALANRVCQVLADPDSFQPLGTNARSMIIGRLDRDRICLPALQKILGF